jgi:hypothetical protein
MLRLLVLFSAAAEMGMMGSAAKGLCLDNAGQFRLEPYTASGDNVCARSDAFRSTHSGRVCCGGDQFFFEEPNNRRGTVDGCVENSGLEESVVGQCVKALFIFDCEYACSPDQEQFLQAANATGNLTVCPRCADLVFERCKRVYFPTTALSSDCTRYEHNQAEFVDNVIGSGAKRAEKESDTCLGGACPHELLTWEILLIVFVPLGACLFVVAPIIIWTRKTVSQHASLDSSSSSSASPVTSDTSSRSSSPSTSGKKTSSDDNNLELDTAWGDDDAPPEYCSSSSG